jgi:peroxiredoxin
MSPQEWKDKTIVLLFLGLECPVANANVPEVKRLQTDFTQQNIDWLGVHSDTGVTAEAALKHAKEFQLDFPILLDEDQKLAAAVGANVLGQVVVLQDQKVVYRGRVDDRFATNGKRRAEPTKFDLQNVLTKVTMKEHLSLTETEAYGCPIPFKKADSP